MNRLKIRWEQKRPCPKCRSQEISLVFKPNGFKKFSLKCENCHWFSKYASTIRGAIRKWNREADKQYIEMLRRAYG